MNRDKLQKGYTVFMKALSGTKKYILRVAASFITWITMGLCRGRDMHDEYDEHYKKYEK